MKTYYSIIVLAGFSGLVLSGFTEVPAQPLSVVAAEAVTETPSTTTLNKESHPYVVEENEREIESTPQSRNWAQEAIESLEKVERLKAGHRKFLQKLKSDPAFAAEWNRQVEANLAKLKETPDEVSPAVDQRQHQYNVQTISEAAKQIDQLIQVKLNSQGMTFNPPTSDEHFLRRNYLQAAGRIPTHEGALTFLTYPDDWAYDDATPGAKVLPRFPSFEHLIKSNDFEDRTKRQQPVA